jgi:hypothetical protein
VRQKKNSNSCVIRKTFLNETKHQTPPPIKLNGRIQERALRFIYNDYVLNYEELLEESKMPSLKVGRSRSIAIETFKIIHQESPIYFDPAYLNIYQFFSKH